MRCTVIGGTGVISAPCARALREAGHEVTIFSRGRRPDDPVAGVAAWRGDRDDAEGLRRALASLVPDVVVDFACYRPEQAEGLIAALPAGCRQLVVVSTVDVYGLPLGRLPMREGDPRGTPGSAYAADKLAAESCLERAARSSGIALTIVRPTYSLGAGFLISLFDRSGAELVARLRLGLPVILPDGGRRRIHVSDARDTARMIALLVGREQAFGQDYTVGTPEGAMSQADYVAAIAEALGVRPNLLDVPSGFLGRDGVLEPDSLWSELTRHDLDFDLGRFVAAFPDFVAVPDLTGAIRAYASRLEPKGDPERAVGPESRIAAAFRDATAA